MSIRSVRIALESRLQALDTDFETAFENVTFKPSNPAEPYQEVRLLPNEPDNAAVGGAYYRERGIFQVTLMYPLQVGVADAETKAKAVRDHFPRGLRLTQDGTTITVDATPTIGPGFRDNDRWRIPVSVNYHAQVFA